MLNSLAAAAETVPLDRTSTHHGHVGGLQALVSTLIRDLRIAVVFGGDKNIPGAVINQATNQRSWKSYEPVARDIGKALGRLGCHHVRLLPDDLGLADRLRNERIDLVWLNTAGVQGRAPVSHAAATLELCGIPYVGHDPLTAALLDNKPMFCRLLRALDIPVAQALAWSPLDGPDDPATDPAFAAVAAAAGSGFVVKPASGRASLHVHHVAGAGDIRAVAHEVYQLTRNTIQIEAFLPGREFCVAVCGPTTATDGRLARRARPFAFAAVERYLAPGEAIFTSMDVRPITAERMQMLDIAGDGMIIDTLHDMAETLYQRMPLRTLVRLDVRADAEGRLRVLEANPKPDLKAPAAGGTSLVAAGLASHGMSYDDLILSLFADRVHLMSQDEPECLDRLLGSSRQRCNQR